MIVEGVNALTSWAGISMGRRLWTSTPGHYERLPKLSIAAIFLTVQAERDGHAPLLTFD